MMLSGWGADVFEMVDETDGAGSDRYYAVFIFIIFVIFMILYLFYYIYYKYNTIFMICFRDG